MDHRKTFLWLVVVMLWLPHTAFAAGNEIRYTGTFSSLAYNKEGGDLLGAELKIVTVRNGYQAALQIAEGGPSQLMVVDVSFDKNNATFTIPNNYMPYGGSVFTGTIDARQIRGVLKFKNGSEMHLTLLRKHSYWD